MRFFDLHAFIMESIDLHTETSGGRRPPRLICISHAFDTQKEYLGELLSLPFSLWRTMHGQISYLIVARWILLFFGRRAQMNLMWIHVCLQRSRSLMHLSFVYRYLHDRHKFFNRPNWIAIMTANGSSQLRSMQAHRGRRPLEMIQLIEAEGLSTWLTKLIEAEGLKIKKLQTSTGKLDMIW